MHKLHVIWDLDGTLINSEREVLDALIRSVREAGFSENNQKKPFRVGPTVDKMLDNAFDSAVLTPQKKAKSSPHSAKTTTIVASTTRPLLRALKKSFLTIVSSTTSLRTSPTLRRVA